ncbi:two-component sensor histidine kinase [Streptomyces venezuelae]|uniref:histidine kinase n=1 Tax=Streptomyces venezuelae TaxID=54571 RepID=A0A5P2CUW0_STRVZ|nr:sensor histidine kinase [Streptomyces venezuelae]QES44659.1 two-component sensor histidine kinase [Streptomyces venezuelae]
MSATPSLPLLKYAPPSVCVAVSWCSGTLFGARAYYGISWLPTSTVPAPGPWQWLLVAVAAGAVLGASRLLSRRPLLSLALLIGASYVATHAIGATNLGFLQYAAVDIAMGSVVATAARGTRVAAVVMALCAHPLHALLRQLLGLPTRLEHNLTSSWSDWQTAVLLAVVAWLVGDSVRRTRAYTERLGAQAAAQAVTAERLRIAREMHDTVAHSIGIIALQAGAAARVVETQPAGAREAMTAVEKAGRETLAGLRRMVVALRESEPGEDRERNPQREPAPRGPAEGLADVDRMAASTTAAGVRVDVVWRGERRPLPADIDLSAFRIIQESVTNVVRHAGTASCTVSVDYREEELTIEIEDAGRGGTGPSRGSGHGAGFGLVGMGERVALLHGEFNAAPRPGGGFLVSATLPVPAAAGAR